MQKLLLIFGLFFLFSCNSPDKENTTGKSGPNSSGITEIVFKQEMHDFGILKSGEIVVYSFVFTNTGDNDFLATNISNNCGCISVSQPEQPVKPGETGVFEIEFDSAGMFGKQLKTIEIEGNTKELKHLAIFATIQNEQIEFKY